jgi:hypothetical protein
MTEATKTAYLKDGRMADLITKTDKGYLVDPYIVWNDYDGQAESAPSGVVELVSEVFITAPVEFIETEYKKVLERVNEQEKIWRDRQTELQKLNSEISILRNQKTDLSRYIINREELRTAKRLILWPTNEIVPRIMDGKESHKFSVSYEISQYIERERVWCYKGYTEQKNEGSWSSYSEYFDEQYGVKVDLTDEEILALTIERIHRFKKNSCSWPVVLLRTPDKWLSPEYIAEKAAIKEKNRIAEIEKAKGELDAAQKKLEILQAKALAVN